MLRRALMAGGLGGLVVALSGCRLGPTRKERLNTAVAEAEHVTSSDLSTSGGGTMRTQLNGDIHFDVAEDQPLTALDQVWRTVVEYVFDLDDGHGGRTVLVTAHGADGSSVEPRQLLGPAVANHHGSVAFVFFFEHYGLV